MTSRQLALILLNYLLDKYETAPTATTRPAVQAEAIDPLFEGFDNFVRNPVPPDSEAPKEPPFNPPISSRQTPTATKPASSAFEDFEDFDFEQL
jgi:hypothetical protein